MSTGQVYGFRKETIEWMRVKRKREEFMKCPRCEAINLAEMERGGIVIDLCEQCRGVWLDRGELEKFMSKARAEDLELERSRSDMRPQYRREDGGRDDDYDDDDHRGNPRKRSWVQTFGNLFD